jgi:CheY-like chemotaxis protein
LNALGGEYCAEIKADPSTRHIPVLMVSAEPQLPGIAEEACAEGYIEKPFGLVTLVQKIKRAIL